MEVTTKVTKLTFAIEINDKEVYRYDHKWDPKELPLLPGEAFSIGAMHFWRGFIHSEAKINFPLRCQVKVYINGKEGAVLKSAMFTIHSLDEYVSEIAIALLMLGSTLEEVSREYNVKRPKTKKELPLSHLSIVCGASAVICYLTSLDILGLSLSVCSLVSYLAYKIPFIRNKK